MAKRAATRTAQGKAADAKPAASPRARATRQSPPAKGGKHKAARKTSGPSRSTRARRCRLYLASPYGFQEATWDFLETRLAQPLTAMGFTVLNPWRLLDPDALERRLKIADEKRRRRELARLNREIGHANRLAIGRCDGLIAVLDGADVDSGVAAEIGYAFGKKKRVVGYRGDFRRSGDNEGALVNLQVEYFIRESGGAMATDLDGLFRAIRRLFG